MEYNDEYIEELKEKRSKAIAERDGIAYVQTTVELGFDLNEVLGLAREGIEKMNLEKKINSLDNFQNNSVSKKLSKLYDIVNRPFSELQSGERISPKEYKQRLGELRQAGWPVKPYSKMRLKGVRNYFSQVQKTINKSYKDEVSGPSLPFS